MAFRLTWAAFAVSRHSAAEEEASFTIPFFITDRIFPFLLQTVFFYKKEYFYKKSNSSGGLLVELFADKGKGPIGAIEVHNGALIIEELYLQAT